MLEKINKYDLFCDYYEQWVSVYKEGAIQPVTMAKYKLSQQWLRRLIPELRLCDLNRTTYQKLINDFV